MAPFTPSPYIEPIGIYASAQTVTCGNEPVTFEIRDAAPPPEIFEPRIRRTKCFADRPYDQRCPGNLRPSKVFRRRGGYRPPERG